MTTGKTDVKGSLNKTFYMTIKYNIFLDFIGKLNKIAKTYNML